MTKICLIPAIPQIEEAAQYLDEAVTAHLAGEPVQAAELIYCADMPEIGRWTESLWGKDKPYVIDRAVTIVRQIRPDERAKQRMPNGADKRSLHLRDGYHCRFCGIPVIRKMVQHRFRVLYPAAARLGAVQPGSANEAPGHGCPLRPPCPSQPRRRQQLLEYGRHLRTV
jgi:hypothetical protein